MEILKRAIEDEYAQEKNAERAREIQEEKVHKEECIMIAPVSGWLNTQPEAENMSQQQRSAVFGVLAGIEQRYGRGFIGSLVRNNLREACRLADDDNITLLPLYARFMDWLEEQR
jgi:hypothetical protein